MERSADPNELARSFGDTMVTRSHSDSRVALRVLIDESAPDDVIVVAGSLYLLGEVRPLLQAFAVAQGKCDG